MAIFFDASYFFREFKLTETENVHREQLLSLQESRQVIMRDWDWWSWFLGRHYFGGPDEKEHWDAAAEDLASDLELQPGMTLLDLGSGCGELALRLAHRGLKVTGVDNSKRLIQDCRKLASLKGVPVTFLTENMFDFTPNETFNIITCINTSFGYGTDEENRKLIATIPSWLRPGGVFYLDLVVADHAEPFGFWSDYLNDGTLIVDNTYDTDQHLMISQPWWIPPEGDEIYGVQEPERVRIYSTEEIESMFREAGLVSQKISHGPGRPVVRSAKHFMETWIARRD